MYTLIFDVPHSEPIKIPNSALKFVAQLGLNELNLQRVVYPQKTLDIQDSFDI